MNERITDRKKQFSRDPQQTSIKDMNLLTNNRIREQMKERLNEKTKSTNFPLTVFVRERSYDLAEISRSKYVEGRHLNFVLGILLQAF